MLALAAARKMMEGLSAAALSDAAATALTKINDALPREIAQRATRFDEVLSAQLGAVHDYAPKSDALRTLGHGGTGSGCSGRSGPGHSPWAHVPAKLSQGG